MNRRAAYISTGLGLLAFNKYPRYIFRTNVRCASMGCGNTSAPSIGGSAASRPVLNRSFIHDLCVWIPFDTIPRTVRVERSRQSCSYHGKQILRVQTKGNINVRAQKIVLAILVADTSSIPKMLQTRIGLRSGDFTVISAKAKN